MIELAVGIGENKNILKAINIFKKQNNDINIKLVKSDDEILECILNNRIQATVRGSLPASDVIKKLKNEFKDISRATYINGEYELLLAPVGIDEGNNIDEKVKIAINCCEFLKKLDKTPKIGILASGRKGDYGRSEDISKSIKESETLTKIINEKTKAKTNNYYILLEQAIKDKCNVIIAPNGIIGNIIFRSLVLLNSWPSYGAITFGVKSIYIDTSRDQNIDGYLRSLQLAYKLAKL